MFQETSHKVDFAKMSVNYSEFNSSNYTDLNDTCRQKIDDAYEMFFYNIEPVGKAFFLTLLTIVIIVGNLLVILAVLVSSRLRTITNIFIASLAVSDFVIGFAVLPFSLTQDVLNVWTFGESWCRIWLALDVWMSTASIYNLVIIALDRYVAVTRPLSYKSLITPGKVAAAVVVAWLWSFLVSFPPMVTAQKGEVISTECTCNALSNGVYYIVFSACSSFYVPFMALLYIYVRIYKKIRRATTAVDKGYVTLKPRATDTSEPSRTVITEEDSASITSDTKRQCKLRKTDPKNSAPVKTVNGAEKKRPAFFMKFQRMATGADALSKAQKAKPCNGTVSGGPNSQEGMALRIHRGKYNPAAPGGSGLSPGSRPAGGRLANAGRSASTTTVTSNPRRLRVTTQMSLAAQPAVVGKKQSAETSDEDEEVLKQYKVVEASLHCPFTANERLLTLMEDNRMRFRRLFISGRSRFRAPLVGKPPPPTILYQYPGGENGSNSPRMTIRQKLHGRYEKKLKREIRAAKTVALVTGCFFLCWSGFCVIYTMRAFPACSDENNPCVPNWAFTLVLWLGYVNSALNPFIYAVCNRQFRVTFKRLMGCNLCFGSENSSMDGEAVGNLLQKWCCPRSSTRRPRRTFGNMRSTTDGLSEACQRYSADGTTVQENCPKEGSAEI